MTLGERIKEYRTHNGISQEELAASLNVSRQAITKWENDKGVPDIDNLIHLSRMMNLTLDELVLGENAGSNPVLEKQALTQRTENKTGLLIGIIGFSVAIVCWIISCILNICNGNDLAAVLNAICAVLLLVPITKLCLRYANL